MIVAKIFSCVPFCAAERVVSGTVVNQKGEVVVGASVQLVATGESNTTVTNGSGEFSMQGPDSEFRLQVEGKDLVPQQLTIAASQKAAGILIRVTYTIAPVKQSLVISATAVTREIDGRNDAIYKNTLFNRVRLEFKITVYPLPPETVFAASSAGRM